MSYNLMSAMAMDYQLRQRLYACAGEQAIPNSQNWVDQNIWNIVANSDWNDAYEQVVKNQNPSPGTDETVITDAMILAQIQAVQAQGA